MGQLLKCPSSICPYMYLHPMFSKTTGYMSENFKMLFYLQIAAELSKPHMSFVSMFLRKVLLWMFEIVLIYIIHRNVRSLWDSKCHSSFDHNAFDFFQTSSEFSSQWFLQKYCFNRMFKILNSRFFGRNFFSGEFVVGNSPLYHTSIGKPQTLIMWKTSNHRVKID